MVFPQLCSHIKSMLPTNHAQWAQYQTLLRAIPALDECVLCRFGLKVSLHFKRFKHTKPHTQFRRRSVFIIIKHLLPKCAWTQCPTAPHGPIQPWVSHQAARALYGNPKTHATTPGPLFGAGLPKCTARWWRWWKCDYSNQITVDTRRPPRKLDGCFGGRNQMCRKRFGARNVILFYGLRTARARPLRLRWSAPQFISVQFRNMAFDK